MTNAPDPSPGAGDRRPAAADSADITSLLYGWKGGDAAALDELLPIVYEELRRLARYSLSGEADGHTLQTTALVHEAYVRLSATVAPERLRGLFGSRVGQSGFVA